MKRKPKVHVDGLEIRKTPTGYRWTAWKSGRKIANGGQAYSRKRDLMAAIATLWKMLGAEGDRGW